MAKVRPGANGRSSGGSNDDGTVVDPSKLDAESAPIVDDGTTVEASGDVIGDPANYSKSEFDALTAKLAAAEGRAKELESQITNLGASGLRVRPDKKPFAGDHGGWKIRVGPRNPELYPDLPVLEVMAVDEGEAKRYYAESQEYPKKSGKQVDPVTVPLVATCLDPRRDRLRQHKARLSTIRRKLDMGVGLNHQDEALLNENEAEIMGY